MKKIIDWANKLPKTLPLILIGIYFIVSLILSRVGTGNGTTSLLSIMTLILQCVVAFLLLFGVYRTDKKIRGGQRVNPYGKLIVIVFHSVLALACIGMIRLKHCNLSTISKRAHKTKPPKSGPKMKIRLKSKVLVEQSLNNLAVVE